MLLILTKLELYSTNIACLYWNNDATLENKYLQWVATKGCSMQEEILVLLHCTLLLKLLTEEPLRWENSQYLCIINDHDVIFLGRGLDGGWRWDERKQEGKAGMALGSRQTWAASPLSVICTGLLHKFIWRNQPISWCGRGWLGGEGEKKKKRTKRKTLGKKCLSNLERPF